MKLLNRGELIAKINLLGSQGTPFVFITDIEGDNGYIFKIDELNEHNISIEISGKELGRRVAATDCNITLNPKPISMSEYKKSFDIVNQHIIHGDAYLLNLTVATHIGKNLSLEAIYSRAKARYKVLLDDKFVCYSPESFVKIKGNEIFSYPMKGTIDQSVVDAEGTLLNNPKELQEHYTIVDLIRNDLAIVAEGIEVTRFRYIDKITTARGSVLQTSSEIKGRLAADWKSRLGTIIFKMLPAGSVSGAPKEMCIEIIHKSEQSRRGFYTGVTGYFDGNEFDSAVNIRFIEKRESGECYYRSGGGITYMSDMEQEYNELITKIYVPIL